MKICHADASIDIEETVVWVQGDVRICRIDMEAGIILVEGGVKVIKSKSPNGVAIVPLNTQVDEEDLIAEVFFRH